MTTDSSSVPLLLSFCKPVLFEVGSLIAFMQLKRVVHMMKSVNIYTADFYLKVVCIHATCNWFLYRVQQANKQRGRVPPMNTMITKRGVNLSIPSLNM